MPVSPAPKTVSGRPIVIGILIVTAIVVTIAAVMLFGRPHGKIAPPPSVVLLITSADPALASQVTTPLTAELSRVADFRVAAGDSILALKNRPNVRDIADRLDVRSVLEGAVERNGSNLHVTARLLNGADEFEFWSKTYDGDGNAIAREISAAMVETLGLKKPQP